MTTAALPDVPDVTETWVVPPVRLVSASNLTACLVNIYPPSATMGSRHVLGAAPLVIGRNDDCEVVIRDRTASRRHALIQRFDDGYEVVDLNSTNGTIVNDQTVAHAPLRDGDYLRIGNHIFRFLTGGNVEADYHEEIYRLSIIDALTGIHNKRYLLEFLDREVTRTTRYLRPLSLVLFDLDHFKAVNDTYGHLAGDRILRGVVDRLRDRVNREDLLARYGGEEFAAVLVETTPERALAAAEEFRRRVEDRPFECEGTQCPLTISLGVVTTSGSE